jgi:hypothetical protein
LNEFEKQNPTVSSGTSVTDNVQLPAGSIDAQGNPVGVTQSSTRTSTSSTSTGGVSREQFAAEFARSAPDWAEYQAATTYMNALFDAIQSPVNI